MKNFLRTRNFLSNDDNNKNLKSEHCSNGLSVNCERDNEKFQDQEDSCQSPLNIKNNNADFQSNTKNQRHSLLNTLKLSPHFNYVLPQLQTTPEKKSYGEMFYKNHEIQKRPRLVKKCGELNIQMENVAKHKRRLFKDFFNTIIDIKWRWHIIVFFLSFLISWFVFATVWYMIAYFHDDLTFESNDPDVTHLSLTMIDEINKLDGFHGNSSFFKSIKLVNNSDLFIEYIPEQHNISRTKVLTNFILKNQTVINEGKDRIPCVYGITDFTTALLYSVETQHTIGYGLRHITEECPFAIFFLMIQSCFGIFVQGLVAGVVFAKISRPNKRKRTIIFSHNAVVSERDGKLCFMFKLGNIRISQLSNASVKMSMIKSRKTHEGEFIPFQSYDMKVAWNDWAGSAIFFPWPLTVEHIIDENSPLFSMYKDRLKEKEKVDNNEIPSIQINSQDQEYLMNETQVVKNEDYEIVVMLEGNIETTGAACHIRTSYLPQEILFGYRFTPTFPQFTNAEYLFDYSKFDQVEPVSFDLMRLNVAHLNPHLNYVCDAKREFRNINLTYQNTLKDNYFSKSRYNQSINQSKSPFVALSSVLAAFKSNITNMEEVRPSFSNNFDNDKRISKSRLDNISANSSSGSDSSTSRTFVRKKSKNLHNEKYINTVDTQTTLINSKYADENFDLRSHFSSCKNVEDILEPTSQLVDPVVNDCSRQNGRFTVCRVNKDTNVNTDVIRNPSETNKIYNKQTMLKSPLSPKSSKQVIFRKNLESRHIMSDLNEHNRASSLPQIRCEKEIINNEKEFDPKILKTKEKKMLLKRTHHISINEDVLSANCDKIEMQSKNC